MDVGRPTLDQLRIFLAVVDEGSFNRAARKLGRAISAVSYGIANLEAQLGVVLFDREGSRRPTLTAAGQALVSEARNVADDVDALMAKLRSLHQGLEAELALAVDVMVSGAVVAGVLRQFQHRFPTVGLRLHMEGLGAVAALVLDGGADIGIAGPDIPDHPALEGMSVGSIELVPVAAPTHPLALLNRLARALFEARLIVHSAHITNYGERAADTFYVTDLLGEKIDSQSRLKSLEKSLLEAADDENEPVAA